MADDKKPTGDTKDVTPPADDKKVDDKVADKTVVAEGDDEEEEDDDDDDGETEEAVRLFRALKNPDSAKQIIRILATEAGMFSDAPKDDKKSGKKAILDVFKEKLGDEYSFLAPKLGPAIEEILAEHTRGIEEKFTQQRQREVARESDDAVTIVMKEHEDFKLHYPKIMELMDEITPSPKLSQKEYLVKLLRIARSEANDSGNKDKRGEKLRKNQNDASGRIKDASVGGNEKDLTQNRQPLSRRQAIREALEELEAQGVKA